MLNDYLEIARRVKRIVEKYDKDAEVYLFGSAVEGRVTVLSDIDIMVVSMKKECEYKVKTEAYKRIEAPIEIHYITPQEYQNWYRRFIGRELK